MSYGNNAIYCSTIDKIPKENHFAIITGSSYTTPGDQRSRDYPGHGYPESTSNYIEYRAFMKREDWEAEIREMTLGSSFHKKQFKAISVENAVIEIKTLVSTSIK